MGSNIVGFCRDCLYWDDISETEGLCRRFAPSALVADPSNKPVVWPVTTPEDWCGEYQLRMGQYARETGTVRGIGQGRIAPGGEGKT